MNRRCIQCNKEFNISEGEERFYRDRNLELPKRCQECRDKNKRKVNTKKYQEDNIRGKIALYLLEITQIILGILILSGTPILLIYTNI